MKVIKLYFNLLACLLILAAGKTLSAQEVGSANPASGCDTVNGTRFNLESRVNAVPQHSESVDFMLSRVSSGVDLVVGCRGRQSGQLPGVQVTAPRTSKGRSRQIPWVLPPEAVDHRRLGVIQVWQPKHSATIIRLDSLS